MKLDPRFLSVHPRTALWWEQREQCQKCAHFRTGNYNSTQHGRSTGMTCAASGGKRNGHGASLHSTCISMRDEGAACGPEGALFTPVESKGTQMSKNPPEAA